MRKAINAGADAKLACFDLPGYFEGRAGDFYGKGSNFTAVFLAAMHGHTNILNILLPAPVSADPDMGHPVTKVTPLHAGCANDSPGVVTLLLQYGANPNVVHRIPEVARSTQ